MKYEISNEYLKVRPTQKVLLFVVRMTDKDGFEYIWHEMTDTGAWPIFFLCCQIMGEIYIFQGKTYHMDIHGLPRILFSPVRKQGRMNWCLQWKIPGKLWNSIHFISFEIRYLLERKILLKVFLFW